MSFNFRISTKIALAAAIPFVALIVFASFVFLENRRAFRLAERMHSNGLLYRSASYLVHEIQKERGKSALFLAGAVQSGDLEEQRRATDEKAVEFKTVYENSRLDSIRINSVKESIQQLEGIRQAVDAKARAAEVIGKYTGLNRALMRFQGILARDGSTNSPEVMFLSMGVLEIAKENAGRIRAAIASILATDQPLMPQQNQALQDLKAGIDVNLDSPALVVSKEGAERIASLKGSDQWKKVNDVYQKILQRAEKGGYEEDSKAFFVTISEVIDQLSLIVSHELESGNAVIQKNRNDAVRNLWVMGVGILALTLVLIFVVGFIVRAITLPLNRVISTLSETSGSVNGVSRQLSSASQQLSSGASEGAASLEETTSSIEKLSAMVKVNADNAKESAAVSQASRRSVTQGESQIQSLIQAMSGVAQSSKKIEEIINVIDDIAFQTNLLALNAAVEAARAGEQGKGFAVVAEAVRGLAQRSASAAKDITVLIKDSVNKIEQGARVADQSNVVLKEIVASINKVAELNSNIADASRQQSDGIHQITQAMSQLDHSTQTNAASAEEAAASAEEMSAQAESLQSLVEELRGIIEGSKREARRPAEVKIKGKTRLSQAA